MELGLIKIQTNSDDNPELDFEWALKRLSSVCEYSRLHGLSIINKAAYHEHVNELMMALHHYGEIPLNGDFPIEIIGFSRIGAARIYSQMGNPSDACRHLYNAHNLFKKSNNWELAWHSGFQFLTMGAAHVDLTADRMEVQASSAKPREVGDEKIIPKIHPSDLKQIALDLKNSEEIYEISSLDGFGTEEFIKIIRYVVKDANVFVISHKSDLHDKFDNVVKFDKIKGFSRIVL